MDQHGRLEINSTENNIFSSFHLILFIPMMSKIKWILIGCQLSSMVRDTLKVMPNNIILHITILSKWGHWY